MGPLLLGILLFIAGVVVWAFGTFEHHALTDLLLVILGALGIGVGIVRGERL